jgi:hypothetical protein
MREKQGLGLYRIPQTENLISIRAWFAVGIRFSLYPIPVSSQTKKILSWSYLTGDFFMEEDACTMQGVVISVDEMVPVTNDEGLLGHRISNEK